MVSDPLPPPFPLLPGSASAKHSPRQVGPPFPPEPPSPPSPGHLLRVRAPRSTSPPVNVRLPPFPPFPPTPACPPFLPTLHSGGSLQGGGSLKQHWLPPSPPSPPSPPFVNHPPSSCPTRVSLVPVGAVMTTFPPLPPLPPLPASPFSPGQSVTGMWDSFCGQHPRSACPPSPPNPPMPPWVSMSKHRDVTCARVALNRTRAPFPPAPPDPPSPPSGRDRSGLHPAAHVPAATPQSTKVGPPFPPAPPSPP